MFSPDQYQLLDFGNGRKLERFGGVVLDRPSPAAAGAERHDPAAWEQAAASFVQKKGAQGSWTADPTNTADPANTAPWVVNHAKSRLILGVNNAGNIGVFPEQAGNWDWIAESVERCRDVRPDSPVRVLNLFGYTGAATLAAAAAGAEVAHVDSSAPTVAWAKRNAEASEMASLPIRWLVEDAIRFAGREVKRGNFYDGVIADPPTYGHGPKGKAFKFHDDVDQLLQLCGRLIAGPEAGHRFLLFSCHAPGFGRSEVLDAVSAVVRNSGDGRLTCRPLSLSTSSGRQLAAGVSARWSITR